ncbi:MAG: hypothetical protein AAFQ16_09480 [Pseudomonadota bacterium]
MKKTYTTPKLAQFGSVRNLTGGSNGTMMDAMINQVRDMGQPAP